MYVHDDGNDQKHKVYKPHHTFTCTSTLQLVLHIHINTISCTQEDMMEKHKREGA